MLIPNSNRTEKQGINLVESMAIDNKCLFHRIEAANDFGIDANIELSQNGKLDGRQIAVQIKTGRSYIDYDKSLCSFAIGKHREYWENHNLSVYGIVCDLDRNCFYYLDIKKHLKSQDKDKSSKSIKFPIILTNTITKENFINLFVCPIRGEIPQLSFAMAQHFANSESNDDKLFAIYILFKYHSELLETWEIFIEIFKTTQDIMLQEQIIRFFSVGTLNPDVWKHSTTVAEQNAATVIAKLTREDILNLFNCIKEEEDYFQRGSTAQCIDFIVRNVPNKLEILSSIVLDEKLEEKVRDIAFILVSFYSADELLKLSKLYDSEMALWVSELVKEDGILSPYA